MELRHLRYFTTVADELNYRRAAERLNLSAPTLSHQIKELEQEVGVNLFDRTTRQVRLSVAGEVFLRQARRILTLAQRSKEMARDAAEGRLGTLRIGNVGALAQTFLPACLAAFRLQHPEVDVTLVETDVDQQVEAVLNGTLHLGFHMAMQGELPHGVSHFPVIQAQFHLIHGRGHRLDRKRQVKLADLTQEQFLSFKSSSTSTHEQFIHQLLSSRGMRVGTMKVLNSYEAFLTVLAGGNGISLLPKVQSRPPLAGLRVRKLSDASSDLDFNASLIWNQSTSTVLVQHFVEVVKQVIRKMDQPKL